MDRSSATSRGAALAAATGSWSAVRPAYREWVADFPLPTVAGMPSDADRGRQRGATLRTAANEQEGGQQVAVSNVRGGDGPGAQVLWSLRLCAGQRLSRLWFCQSGVGQVLRGVRSGDGSR